MNFVTKEQQNEINILEKNKNPLNTDYISSINANYSGFNSNNDSISQIIKSINNNLAELTYIQNQLNTVTNLQQEALLKKETLLKLQNDKLLEQLRTLENIQSTIINKDRNIEQVNDNIENTNLNIRILSIGIILSLIFLLVIVLTGFNLMSEFQRNVCIVIVSISFLILVIYTYNVFYFRDSISGIYKSQNILSSAVKGLDDFKKEASHDIRESLYGNENDWLNENCNCPLEENITEENLYAYDVNRIVKEIPGDYYYDKSAPPQLLVPSPDDLSVQSDEKIKWVDYSSNGVLRYDYATKKTYNENNNYYNYKNSNPNNKINLNKINPFVNSTTTTGNL